jgi:predicted DNA-binding transcriptional regulator YafY
MSRTGRLFMLMDAMRGYRRPVTAAKLAEQLGVSERTIYRDIQTLSGLGARAGRRGRCRLHAEDRFFLPPLMFGADELEALVLVRAGCDGRAMKRWPLPPATRWPRSPPPRRKTCATTWPKPAVGAVWQDEKDASDVHVRPVREAIRYQHRLRMSYRDEHGVPSDRVVWPFALAFFDGKRAAGGMVRDAHGVPPLPRRPHRGGGVAAAALPGAPP